MAKQLKIDELEDRLELATWSSDDPPGSPGPTNPDPPIDIDPVDGGQ